MIDRNTVRRGYDELMGAYDAERAEDVRGNAILDEFLDSIATPARILDVGCGPGIPVLRKLSAEATALGVDLSREQLDLAAANVPEAARVQGEMTRLPVRDDACDAATAFHSLIHVPLEDHGTAIDEFARVLRPGGRVLLSEGSEEWCGTNPDWLERGVEMQWNVAGVDATRDQLRAAGFTITDEWGTAGTFADNDERWLFVAATLEA
ncbi:class I SAM-dependent methyltransferase [Natronorubrum texcoconense]|uniref:Methyltransferase domain-containing protein n=1 Tax=Natronorubrum texcoconense TaxID=1095776 RepID=A0A1G9AFK9_9EURY|nr:class I SAM-dependent methyltransferase [Natronorubrum texcoconense]SDK25310.1 Methyltransferase domain-containing protein [Natronorubrum texcoconense]